MLINKSFDRSKQKSSSQPLTIYTIQKPLNITSAQKHLILKYIYNMQQGAPRRPKGAQSSVLSNIRCTILSLNPVFFLLQGYFPFFSSSKDKKEKLYSLSQIPYRILLYIYSISLKRIYICKELKSQVLNCKILDIYFFS